VKWYSFPINNIRGKRKYKDEKARIVTRTLSLRLGRLVTRNA